MVVVVYTGKFLNQKSVFQLHGGIYSGGRGGCSTPWPQGGRPLEGKGQRVNIETNAMLVWEGVASVTEPNK